MHDRKLGSMRLRQCLLALVMLLLAGVAAAQPQSVNSVRLGGQIIAVGDSRARVANVAGKPDHIVTLENRFGGAVAQRWEYFSIGSPQAVALSIEIRGGRVASMTREILR